MESPRRTGCSGVEPRMTKRFSKQLHGCLEQFADFIFFQIFILTATLPSTSVTSHKAYSASYSLMVSSKFSNSGILYSKTMIQVMLFFDM